MRFSHAHALPAAVLTGCTTSAWELAGVSYLHMQRSREPLLAGSHGRQLLLLVQGYERLYAVLQATIDHGLKIVVDLGPVV